MIVVPAGFLEMPRWWHDDAGREWLSTLPQRVADQAKAWGLSIDGHPQHGSNALVVPVRRYDRAAVLRLTPPSDDLESEVQALRHWADHGVVELLDSDVSSGALLLDRLDDGGTLAEEPIDTVMHVLGETTARLAIPAPLSAPSTRVIARAASAAYPPAWDRLGRPCPERQLVEVVAAAERLAGGDEGTRSANGDLHPDQVLRDAHGGWTVVDPVLLRGDPEYDLGRALWSCFDERAEAVALEGAIRIYVEAAEVPIDRAHDWIAVRALSYLLWGLDHGLTTDPPRCRRLLDFVVDGV